MSRTLSLAVEGGPRCGVLDLSANMPKSEQAAERNARVALASVKEVEPAGDLSEQSDEALIDLALSGEQASFETLVGRHSRRVFTIARHFFRRPEMVEDIAQETFAKAFFSLSTYRRGASGPSSRRPDTSAPSGARV